MYSIYKQKSFFTGGNIIHSIFIRNILSLCLFASLVWLIQLSHHWLIGAWLIVAMFFFTLFDHAMKKFIVTTLLFGIGFSVYLYALTHWTEQFPSKELEVFLNRGALIFVLIPLFCLSFFSHSPFINYWKKPKWREAIYFPFIWSGFHRTSIKAFLCIALVINTAALAPFVIRNGWSFFEDIWLLMIIFSITNALLEEIIWRGALLSRFSEQVGEKWAVVITSIGFGLQHYSLGFPWLICIAFSIGGFFYGGITVKSGSLIPAVVWHLVLNMLMVLSGLILT